MSANGFGLALPFIWRYGAGTGSGPVVTYTFDSTTVTWDSTTITWDSL